MVSGVRVVMDKEGMNELLTSNEILQEMMSVGERVASAAGPEYEATEWMRPTRAVCNVIDSREGAMFIEATTGNLARAVGKS